MKHIIKRITQITAVCISVLVMLASTAVPAKAVVTTEITGKTFPSFYITSINIGASVTSISDDAFINLHDLRRITVSEGNQKYCSFGDCLYSKDKTELICIPQALSGVSIPNSVIKLSPYALEGRSPSFRKKVKDIVEKNGGGTQDKKTVSKVDTTSDVEDSKDAEVSKDADDSVKTECADTPLGNAVKTVLASLSVDGMSRDKALRACYDFMMKEYSYKRFTDIFDNGWTGTYALDLFTTGKGNCSSYAAGLAYLAKGLGYESRVATGKIDSVAGLPTSHAWTEIKMDGKWYIFDAEMDQAKANKEYYKKSYADYPSSGLTKEMEWSCEF